MIPSFRDTLTTRKEKDLHALVVRCTSNSGMKGIYVRDGIKIDVYNENEFDEVAKSFCVYGGCRAVMGHGQYPDSSLVLLCLNLYLSLPSDVLTSRKAAIRGLPVSELEFSISVT